MSSVQTQTIKDLFDNALDLAPEERARFLAEACAGDEGLFIEVQKLLRLHDDANDFLEAPPLINELPDSSPAINSDAVIDRRIGAYRVIRELGRGGMGAVFLAHRADQAFEKQVAIKLVWPGLGAEEIIQRFQQERQILAKLEHPNIARLLDGGVTEDGWHYIVMEYIAGVPITQYCGSNLLSIEARLQLFRAVCEAVQFAHQNLVIHRDLKPGNILVTNDGTPKLLDFGIAKLLEQNESSLALTHTQLPLTPEYASPEQLNNESITTATDVYSLGVVLYEILTRRKPYHFKSPLLHEVVRVVSEVEPDKPNLDDDLENIVLLAMRKEPQLRYASVEQFNADIGRYLTGQTVFARKATAGYLASKFVRRHKLTVTLAALLLLTLVTVAIVSVRTAITSREQARTQRRQLYATQMNQAMQDWELGNFSRMRETIDAWLPQNGQEDLRGFEWNYLWQLRNPKTISFRHSTNEERGGLDFSDHDNYVIESNQKLFTLWDAKTGQKVNAMDFSSFKNAFVHGLENEIPVDTENAGTAQIISLRTGQSLYSFPLLDDSFLTFDMRHGSIFTGHKDGSVKIWDASTRQLRSTVQCQDAPVTAIYFTQNSQKIFTRSAPQEWRLRDIQRGTFQTIKAETAKALPHSSPDGKYFVFFESGVAVRVFASATGRELGRITAPSEAILNWSFSPDSQNILITSTDSTAKLFRLPSLEQVAVFRSANDWMPQASISPNGKLMMAICGSLYVKLWDITTQREIAIIKGHEGKVIGAKFSHDGTKIITWSNDGLAQIWEVGEMLKRDELTGHSDGVFALAYSADGKTLASVSKDHSIKLWDAQTRQLVRTINGHTDWVFAIAFSPDGQTLATGGRDNTIRLWDAASGSESKKIVGHNESVRAVAFSPDGNRIVSASSDSSVRVWSVASGQELNRFAGHRGEVYSIAYSPDGTQILSAGADDTARIWDAQSGQELKRLQGHSENVWSAKYSPDGSTIATAGADRLLKLWDANTGQEIKTLSGHANDIFSLAWLPDGSRIATASNDKTVRLWNVALGMEVLSLRNHTEQVWSVAFTPNGDTLASASWDQTIRLWRVATTQ